MSETATTSTSIGSIKDSEYEGILGFVGPFTIKSGKFGKYLTIKNTDLDKTVGQIIQEVKEASDKRKAAFMDKKNGGGGGNSSGSSKGGYAKPYTPKPSANNNPKGW